MNAFHGRNGIGSRTNLGCFERQVVRLCEAAQDENLDLTPFFLLVFLNRAANLAGDFSANAIESVWTSFFPCRIGGDRVAVGWERV